jgi:hypothetical protein
MDDRVARLESAIAVLTDHVRDLELRLAGLEGGGAPDAMHPHAVVPPAADFERAAVQQWLALAGRTLVVLGGAYLLRALTDAHVLPTHIGIALGLLYGAPWLLLASRAGARGAHLDALSHALATALIGYPLVWEATIRFRALTPGQSAALLGALTAAALVLAALRNLHSLAWVVTFGALGSAAGLAVATRDWNSYTLLAIGVGLGTLWLGYVRGWSDVRWLAAAGANLMLLVATGRAVVTGDPHGALALQLLMFAGYVGSFAARSIAGTHPVSGFAVAQSAAAIALALGGSLFLLQSNGAGLLAAGLGTLALGVAAYLVAFRFVRPRRNARTFVVCALFALVLATIGTVVCFGAPIASAVFAASAAILSVVAQRRRSPALGLHASVYAMAAALGSGLLGMATLAMVSPPAGGWTPLNAAALMALVALAVTVATPVRPAAESWPVLARIPRAIVVGTLVWTSMGLAVLLATPAIADPSRIDLSILATVRTGILVAATLALARMARHERGREAGWLMYPLLVLTGVKLVFVDFPIGRPETLFAALALYGTALIAAPRMWRGPAERSAREPATEREPVMIRHS